MNVSNSVIAVALCAVSLSAAHAATLVQVTDGQTLTEADLLAGSFNGQSFTLGAGTTFSSIGGMIGPVGTDAAPFDASGSTFRLSGLDSSNNFSTMSGHVSNALVQFTSTPSSNYAGDGPSVTAGKVVVRTGVLATIRDLTDSAALLQGFYTSISDVTRSTVTWSSQDGDALDIGAVRNDSSVF